MGFEPVDPEFETRLKASFARQGAMATLGIKLVDFAPGWVVLGFDYDEKITQHHGYVHAGVLTTAMDSAAGYAAATLMAPNKEVLTVEFKANWLRPAAGERFVARGEVIKPGRTITYAESSAFAVTGDKEVLVARLTATLMAVDGG